LSNQSNVIWPRCFEWCSVMTNTAMFTPFPRISIGWISAILEMIVILLLPITLETSFYNIFDSIVPY
jgi:hypothetical protein